MGRVNRRLRTGARSRPNPVRRSVRFKKNKRTGLLEGSYSVAGRLNVPSPAVDLAVADSSQTRSSVDAGSETQIFVYPPLKVSRKRKEESVRPKSAPEHLVSPVRCERCGGSGRVSSEKQYRGVSGLCFRCEGSGFQESDPVALKEDAARRANEKIAEGKHLKMHAVTTEFAALYDKENSAHKAVAGLNALKVLEPDRYLKALRNTSVNPRKICEGLDSYYRSHAQFLKENGGNNKIETR